MSAWPKPSVPASNVVGLASPIEALFEFEMMNWKAFPPYTWLRSQSHPLAVPFAPPPIDMSSIFDSMFGRKPFGYSLAITCVV